MSRHMPMFPGKKWMNPEMQPVEPMPAVRVKQRGPCGKHLHPAGTTLCDSSSSPCELPKRIRIDVK